MNEGNWTAKEGNRATEYKTVAQVRTSRTTWVTKKGYRSHVNMGDETFRRPNTIWASKKKNAALGPS